MYDNDGVSTWLVCACGTRSPAVPGVGAIARKRARLRAGYSGWFHVCDRGRVTSEYECPECRARNN